MLKKATVACKLTQAITIYASTYFVIAILFLYLSLS